MKFRKKPVVIEAVQYDGTPISALKCDLQTDESRHPAQSTHWGIKTLEGFMEATAGDWIITGVKGERYPCKPDIFEATYEPI